MTIQRRKLPKVELHTPRKPIAPQRVAQGPKPELVEWAFGEKFFVQHGRRIIFSAAVLLSCVLQPKQTVLTMLDWLKDRLSEPSTYRGLVAMAGAAGYTIDPDGFAAIVAIVLAIVGVVDFVKSDAKLIQKTLRRADDDVDKPTAA